MLTTTVDGLWVLQAVTGVEQTCPELGLRPLLPRLDTAERALRHPVAAELMAVGALDQAGNADPMVREWLTVLLRRDLGLLVTIGVPGGEPTRAAICRFATWWVVLERHGNLVRLYPAGTASDEAGAGELVVGQVERLCGVAEAAPATAGHRRRRRTTTRRTRRRHLAVVSAQSAPGRRPATDGNHGRRSHTLRARHPGGAAGRRRAGKVGAHPGRRFNGGHRGHCRRAHLRRKRDLGTATLPGPLAWIAL